MEDGSHVTIGLKDVYQQVQSMEKTVADAFATLNLTMVSIKGHLEQLDTRNASADQIHVEHGQRIAAAETVLLTANLPAVLPDHETRVRGLERFKYMLLGAVILINGAAALIEYLLSRHH